MASTFTLSVDGTDEVLSEERYGTKAGLSDGGAYTCTVTEAMPSGDTMVTVSGVLTGYVVPQH